MNEEIAKLLKMAAEKAGIIDPDIKLEHPEDITHGDFSSNIAMVHAKKLGLSPKVLAEKIVEEFNKTVSGNILPATVALPGFINITVADSFFIQEIARISKSPEIIESLGRIDKDKGKKIMVEYTDPNPFKVFHIGHLMANSVGESLSRIVEFSGARIVRACYQGDVGLHVAKTIWAIMEDQKSGSGKAMDIQYLGSMYVIGSEKYEIDETAKKEIIETNKKVFEKSDAEINKVYEEGRKLSLEYFDTIYKKLGTKFDVFFFESEVADDGIMIVKKFLVAEGMQNDPSSSKGVFEKSEGAIVFPGEKYGEHTRVFINSQGLPTYEAKELGLTAKKFQLYPDLDESIVVTANEQNAYFKVILAVLKEIFPEIHKKMKHISHGILRPASGKMASRKGNVVSAEDLISDFETLVEEKMKDREFDSEEKKEIVRDVAIAGLKYSILRQAIGGDIIYDKEKAISFEGDSGPYLQYATVRADAVITKAEATKIPDFSTISDTSATVPTKASLLEKLLLRFPEVIERARNEYAPHHIITYLTLLSSAFNSYYANNQIIDEKDPVSPYRVGLTKVFSQTMKNGLWVLGIRVPKKM